MARQRDVGTNHADDRGAQPSPCCRVRQKPAASSHRFLPRLAYSASRNRSSFRSPAASKARIAVHNPDNPVRDHVGPETTTVLMPTANISSVITTYVNLSSDFRYEAPANAALLRSLGTILRPDDFYRGRRAGDRLVMGGSPVRGTSLRSQLAFRCSASRWRYR